MFPSIIVIITTIIITKQGYFTIGSMPDKLNPATPSVLLSPNLSCNHPALWKLSIRLLILE
jgi:hypothetical protein